MEAVCKTCNLSLKLPAAALPAGAKLYCPKCSKALEIMPDRAKAPAPVPPPAAPIASTFQSAYQSQPAAPAAPSHQPPYQSQPVVPAAPSYQPPYQSQPAVPSYQPPYQSQPVVAAPAPPPPPAPSPGAGGSWDSFLSGINPPQSQPPVPAPQYPPVAPSYPPAAPAPSVGLGIPAAPSPSYPPVPQPPAFQGFPPSDRMTMPMMPAVTVPPAPSSPPPSRPASATEQLFSEDLVPDTEGEVDKNRENLFVKADSVWYGAPEDAPAAPPPTPSGPPKIPQGQGPQQAGYIKATDSIQVDTSLFAPAEKKEFQAPPPVPPKPAAPAGADGIPSGGGRMELDLGGGGSSALELAVTTPPHPSVSPGASQSIELDGKPPQGTHPSPHRHASGPIKLVSTTPKKSMNITIPAIVVGVLLVAAALLYLFAGHTSTKEKFDLAAANNPRTGTLPSTSSAPIKGAIAKVEEKVAEPAKEEEKPDAKETPDDKAAKVAKKAVVAPKEKDDARPAGGGAAPKDTGKKAAQEHYSLGNQYFMQQRFDMSAEEYKAAVRADASYAYAYRGLGAAYARLGKADLAVKQYETYIKLVPSAPDAEQVKKIINDYYGK